jgi:cytidylate kinase
MAIHAQKYNIGRRAEKRVKELFESNGYDVQYITSAAGQATADLLVNDTMHIEVKSDAMQHKTGNWWVTLSRAASPGEEHFKPVVDGRTLGWAETCNADFIFLCASEKTRVVRPERLRELLQRRKFRTAKQTPSKSHTANIGALIPDGVIASIDESHLFSFL